MISASLTIRSFLERAHAAMEGPGAVTRGIFQQHGTSCGKGPEKFLAVFDQDAYKAQAAMERLPAQPAISSQLIDNLNPPVHLHTLLTEIFGMDETLKLTRAG